MQALTPLDTQYLFPHFLLLRIRRQQKTLHLSGGGTGPAIMMMPLTAPHRYACTAAFGSPQLIPASVLLSGCSRDMQMHSLRPYWVMWCVLHELPLDAS